MPRIKVELNEQQYAHVLRLAEASESDAATVIQMIVEIDRTGDPANIQPDNAEVVRLVTDLYHVVVKGKKPSHPLSVLTPQDDKDIYHLRQNGYTWPGVMEHMSEVNGRTYSYGAVRRAYQRYLKQL